MLESFGELFQSKDRGLLLPKAHHTLILLN